jgi:hypothetical protein
MLSGVFESVCVWPPLNSGVKLLIFLFRIYSQISHPSIQMAAAGTHRFGGTRDITVEFPKLLFNQKMDG